MQLAPCCLPQVPVQLLPVTHTASRFCLCSKSRCVVESQEGHAVGKVRLAPVALLGCDSFNEGWGPWDCKPHSQTRPLAAEVKAQRSAHSSLDGDFPYRAVHLGHRQGLTI